MPDCRRRRDDDDQAAVGSLFRELRQGGSCIAVDAQIYRAQLHATGSTERLYHSPLPCADDASSADRLIAHDSDALNARNFQKQLEPFAAQSIFELRKSSRVSTWPA